MNEKSACISTWEAGERETENNNPQREKAARSVISEGAGSSVAKRVYWSEYRKKNAAKCKESQRIWRERNAEKLKKDKCAYREANREILRKKARDYHALNREEGKARSRKWFQTNKQRAAARTRERLKKNPGLKMWDALRSRVRIAVRKNCGKKAHKTSALVGCSVVQLRAHLERQFKPWMNWENYGTAWVIDHILPCATFDLTKEDHQKACFHWTNLQPLSRLQNRLKSDTIIAPQMQLLLGSDIVG